MIYFFYGEDNLRIKREHFKVWEDLKKKESSLESMEIDLEEDENNYKKVIEFISQQSIFGGKKVVLVYNSLLKNKEWIKFIKEQIKSKDILILISKESPIKEFNFLLEPEVKNKEFKELEGLKLKEFIQNEAEENGIKLNEEALTFFFNYLSSLNGSRSWIIFLELKKASFLGKKVITKEDLENISIFPQFDKVWVLTKQILKSNDLKERLSALEKMILAGEDYFYIFNSLAFNAPPSKAEKLANLDLAVKSGKIDIKEALFLFVLE